MNKKITRRAAAVAGAAGVAVMGLTSLGAGGAAAGPLPGGSVTKTLVDGTPVTIRLTNEYVNVQRAVTNVQTSREVWISGKVRVTVGGEAKGGSIKAGYIVGCQLDFGAGANGGADAKLDPSDLQNPQVSGGAEVGGGFTLGPGQAKYVPIIDETSGDNTAYEDYNVSDYTFKGKTGGVAYSQEKFGVDGCAGYAAAKAKIQVKVSTDAVKGIVTLYGKPFSLG
ncbi:hypothetical protein GCM10009624_19220 [Gordonia sinesedis]